MLARTSPSLGLSVPVRVAGSIVVMIMILFLMAMYFVQQPLSISMLNAGQAAHAASGTWSGHVPALYALMRSMANLTVPCLVVVLVVYWLLRSHQREWRGEYE